MADHVESLVESWLTFSAAAEELGIGPTQVRQLVREHQLAAVRHRVLKEPAVPADFVLDGQVVKGLAGTLMLLTDHGLSDRESIEWLFAADDSLPGRPIDALREDRGKEVRRRAQVVV
ncbi:MAG: DNA-binding protein [Nocardioidaceae bacterium]|nr:DNA-binding protein [Nocardioidaceae bacterium]